MLVAPTCILAWIKTYCELYEPRIRPTYIALNCKSVTPDALSDGDADPSIAEWLRTNVGVTSLSNVKVNHCHDSFALVATLESWGKVVYSGDCRPSEKVVEAGLGSNIVIHEATFEDEMKAEAYAKRHCTVSEALDVGARCGAKYTVLTHFSQRYPKYVELPAPPANPDEVTGEVTCSVTDSPKVVVAWDFMRLTPSNIDLAAAVSQSSVLRKAFPPPPAGEEDEESLHIANDVMVKVKVKEKVVKEKKKGKTERRREKEKEAVVEQTATEFLNTPGAFAKKTEH